MLAERDAIVLTERHPGALRRIMRSPRGRLSRRRLNPNAVDLPWIKRSKVSIELNVIYATALALLFTGFTAVGSAGNASACKESGSLPEHSIFIGYTKPGESTLRPFSLVVAKELSVYDGRNLTEGLDLYEIASPVPATIAS